VQKPCSPLIPSLCVAILPLLMSHDRAVWPPVYCVMGMIVVNGPEKLNRNPTALTLEVLMLIRRTPWVPTTAGYFCVESNAVCANAPRLSVSDATLLLF
jgi:hypothetical protein